MSESWNPWHGCTRVSPGCLHCYVYRQDEAYGQKEKSTVCQKTKAFEAPVKRRRDGSYSIPSGTEIMTCFTSDFLLEDADLWRGDCWKMMRERTDCTFTFFTKRIERLSDCLPDDWGDGYENVSIGCTVEDQCHADKRLPVFLALPIKHRLIVTEPLLGAIDLTPYLDGRIEEVLAGGESGEGARVCDYDWVRSLREQCVRNDVSFHYHQTGARLRKDGKLFHVRREDQLPQARKAGIDYDSERVQRALPLPEREEQLTMEGF